MLDSYLPRTINSGPWITAWSLFQLRALPADTRFVLPICSLATPYQQLETLGDVLLPPLFHEAMSARLKEQIVRRIVECFPVYGQPDSNAERVVVVDVPPCELPEAAKPSVLAFSVDTAVEEHGPHLPLGTDTIQSYSVLSALSRQFDRFELQRPVEYGQLTWGLPFGFSVDIGADLLTEYVCGYVNAVAEWRQPEAVYVVDVHGSITHRQAIIAGLSKSSVSNWAFRWLHEPLAEFASARGDQHAGGVETALVALAGADLVDRSWFPERIDEIAAGCMTLEKAVELTPDLHQFEAFANAHGCNGIVGDIRNYLTLDAELMFQRMLNLAAADVSALLSGNVTGTQQPGQNLW